MQKNLCLYINECVFYKEVSRCVSEVYRRFPRRVAQRRAKSTVSPRLAPDKRTNLLNMLKKHVFYPAYSPQVHQTDEAHLQMKNYVTTVLLRQNWVEKPRALMPMFYAPEAIRIYQLLLLAARASSQTNSQLRQTLGGRPSRIDTLQASVLTGIEDAIKMLGRNPGPDDQDMSSISFKTGDPGSRQARALDGLTIIICKHRMYKTLVVTPGFLVKSRADHYRSVFHLN